MGITDTIKNAASNAVTTANVRNSAENAVNIAKSAQKQPVPQMKDNGDGTFQYYKYNNNYYRTQEDASKARASQMKYTFNNKEYNTRAEAESARERYKAAVTADYESVGRDRSKYDALIASGNGISQISDNELAFIQSRYADSDISKRKAYTNSATDAYLSSMGLPSYKELSSYRQKYSEYLGNGGVEQYKELFTKKGDNLYATDATSWIQEQWAKDNATGLGGATVTKKGADIKYADTYVDEQLKSMGLPPSSQLNEYYVKYTEEQKAKQKEKEDKATYQKQVDNIFSEVKRLEDSGMSREDAFSHVSENYKDFFESAKQYEDMPDYQFSSEGYDKYLIREANKKKWANYEKQQKEITDNANKALSTPAVTPAEKKKQYQDLSKYLSLAKIEKEDGSYVTAADYEPMLKLFNAGVPQDVISSAWTQGVSALYSWNDTANADNNHKWAITKALIDGVTKDDGDYSANIDTLIQIRDAKKSKDYESNSRYDATLYNDQINPTLSTSRSTAVSTEGALYNAVNGKEYGNIVGADENQREFFSDMTSTQYSDKPLISYMSEDEVGLFNLKFKESPKKAVQFLESLQSILEKRQAVGMRSDVLFATSKEQAEESAYHMNLKSTEEELNSLVEGQTTYWHKEAWDRYSSYSDEALQRIIDSAEAEANSALEEPLSVQFYNEDSELSLKIRDIQYVLDERAEARADAQLASSFFGYTSADGQAATEQIKNDPNLAMKYGSTAMVVNGMQSPEGARSGMTNGEAVGYLLKHGWKENTEGNLVVEMTAEQKDRYNWLLLNAGAEQANKYYESIRTGLDVKASQKVAQGYDELAGKSKLGASLASVASMPFSGLAAIGGSALNLLTGTKQTATQASQWDVSGGLTEAVTKGITEDLGEGGFTNVVNFLYNVGMSSANSAVGALLSSGVPFAGELALSASAYASTLRSGLQKGLSAEQATSTAVAAAVVEFVTEHMGIDHIMDGLKAVEKESINGGMEYMKALLKQAGINFLPEALEEGVGNVINTAADMFINGDSAEIIETYNNAIAKGYSKEEAEKIAIGNFAKETALESLAGGLAGGGSVMVAGTATGLQRGIPNAILYGAYRYANGDDSLVLSGHTASYSKGKSVVENLFGKEYSDAVQAQLDVSETVGQKRNINLITEQFANIRNTDELYDYVYNDKGKVKLSKDEQIALAAALNGAGSEADLDSMEVAFVQLMAEKQTDRQMLANVNNDSIKSAQELREARTNLQQAREGIETAKANHQREIDAINTKLKDAQARLATATQKLTGDAKNDAVVNATISALNTEISNHQLTRDKINGDGFRALQASIKNSERQIASIQQALDRHYASYHNLLSSASSNRSVYAARYANSLIKVNEIGQQIDDMMSSEFADANDVSWLDAVQTQLADAESEAQYWQKRMEKSAPSTVKEAIQAAHSGRVKEYLASIEAQAETASATAQTASPAKAESSTESKAKPKNTASEDVKQDSATEEEADYELREDEKPPIEKPKKKTYNISKTVQDKFNRLAGKFGLKIVWQTWEEIGGNGRYDRITEPNVVYLATDMIADEKLHKDEVVARAFFSHEVVHYVATTQWYQRLSMLAEKYYKQLHKDKDVDGDDFYEFLIQKQKDQEKELHHRDFTREQAREELTAYFVQDVLFNGQSGNRNSLVWLTRVDGNATSNFLTAVEYLIKQGQVRRMKDGNPIRSLLLEAERTLALAIEERKLLDAKGLSSAFSNEKISEQKKTEQKTETKSEPKAETKTAETPAEQEQTAKPAAQPAVETASAEENATKDVSPAEQPKTAETTEQTAVAEAETANTEQAAETTEQQETKQPAPKTEVSPAYWATENGWAAANKEIGAEADGDPFVTVMYTAKNMDAEISRDIIEASMPEGDDALYKKVDKIASAMSKSGVSPAAVVTYLNNVYNKGGADAVANIPFSSKTKDSIVSEIKQIDAEHGGTSTPRETIADVREIFNGEKSKKKRKSTKKTAETATQNEDKSMHSVGTTINELSSEYMSLAKKYDANGDRSSEWQLEDMVEKAAKKAGYDTPKLYHGTRSFGFTEFSTDGSLPWAKRGYIYASTKREVSANYGGRDYAGVRNIGKYDGGSSAESIINDAKYVFGSSYAVPTEEEVANRIRKDYSEAEKVQERLNELFVPFSDYPRDVSNAIDWTTFVPNVIVDNDLSFDGGVDGILNATQEERSMLKADIEDAFNRAKEYKYEETIRDYFNEHRNEMSDKEKEFFRYLMSYDFGDALTHFEYGFVQILEPSNLLINKATGSFRDMSEFRESLDQAHSVASYQLYGNLGDKPFIFDANGSQFWALKVPEVSDGYTDTDAVVKWAKEHGYTSVVMKNIYDYGDKADNYVFFNSNQVKSADPVTYDDNGNIIPLEERFKNNKKDIRYSVGTTIEDLSAGYNPNVSGMGATLSGENVAVTDAQEAIDKNAVLVNENGEPVMNVINNGNGAMFSTGTFDVGGREALNEYLKTRVKDKKLDESQANDIKKQIEDIYKTCRTLEGKHASFSQWADAKVDVGEDGKPVFSVIRSNSEYPMNIDFSLVCVKRRALDAVFNEVIKNGKMEDIILDDQAIVLVNEAIRKYGFETACTMCFVEAKRFQQSSAADRFVEKYNNLVKSLGGEADYFNFGGNEHIKQGAGVQFDDDSKLDFTKVNEIVEQYNKKTEELREKKLKEAKTPKQKKNAMTAKAATTVEEAIALELKNNPKSRRLVQRGDFMSTNGFKSVAKNAPNILTLYNKQKGTGGPKASFGDMQYLNDIEKKKWKVDDAYAVGGVRVQSFSDFVPSLAFDYVQMIADLAAGKLPSHAYTKEKSFAMLFGKTGMKINMSLVPMVADDGLAVGMMYKRDANGNFVLDENGNKIETYAWAAESFGFDREQNAVDMDFISKIQGDSEYGKNCGTIAIGVSDEHILKMMADPSIKMVIPYHKSSLNPVVAKMEHIESFNDYTGTQHTRKYVVDEKTGEGKWKNLSSKEEYKFNTKLRELGDPKAVIADYLAWCEKNEYAPKFETDNKSAKFKNEEGYYKLLEDFTLYDDNGNYVQQEAVQMNFPKSGDAFGSFSEILDKSLGDYEQYRTITDEATKALAKEVLEISDRRKAERGEMYSTGTTINELSSEYMSLLDKYQSGDTSVEPQMQSLVEQAAKNAMPNSVVRVDGNMQVVYHGSVETFNEFDKNQIRAVDYDAPFNGFWFTSNESDANPAMRSANYVRAFYLDIKNPAPYSVWRRVNREVSDSWFQSGDRSAVRDGARSLNDEVRYRLQDMGYDGVHYSGAYNFDEENVKEYNEKGETTFTDASGRKYDLRKSEYDDARLYPHGSWNEIIPYETAEDFLADNNNEYRKADVWVAFEPNQIKSADTITYDNNGKPIPLNERFNTTNPETKNDVRYSLGTTIDDLIAEYGKKQQSARGKLNDIETPKRTKKTTRVSDVAQTLKETPVEISKRAKDRIDEIIVETLNENAVPVVHVGKEAGLVYRPMKMEEMDEMGEEYVTRSGSLDQAMRDLARDIPNATVGDLTRIEAAAMKVFADLAVTDNFDPRAYGEFISAIGILNSTWGRMGKAMQLLNASPLGRRKYMEKVVERLNAENAKAMSRGVDKLFHKNGVKQIEIEESLYLDLQNATTPEEVRKAEFRISEEIGKQSPLSVASALRNWRYFAMLANPVTHERNMLGNMAMYGMRSAKDVVASGIESAMVRTGLMDAEDRTHNTNFNVDKEIGDYAVALFIENAENVQGNDKYGVRDKMRDAIKKSPVKFVDRLMRFNGNMLEKEDAVFLRLTYVSAAKQYIVQRGFDVNDMTARQKAEVHQYAKQQAQEATYRDASALADTLNMLARRGGLWQFFVESTVPFKKTPVNITKRGLEYSPLGLMKGVIDLASYAKKHSNGTDYRISASKIADELGKGIVGSALSLIGFFLAKAGILKLKAGDDDRDEAYEKDLGHQDYSLEIGNMSIKIESLVPMTFPLFAGAAVLDALSDDEKKNFIPAMGEAMLTIADPLMDMSFMSSLDSVLSSYNKNKLLGIVENMAASYVGQFFPTVTGRLNSTWTPTRRTTKSAQSAKEGIGTQADYRWRSYVSKIPFANLFLQPYVKTTGEYDKKMNVGDYALAIIDNFLSPVNIQIIDSEPVKVEMSRLVTTTGNTDFIPKNPAKYFTVSGQPYNLTASEYTEYSKDHNESVYAVLTDVINSEEYRNAETDDDRVEMLSDAYDSTHKAMLKKWKAIIVDKHSKQ